MGQSGCGKTSLLKILAGLDRDYQGLVSGLEGKKAFILFQDFALFESQTVEGNIMFALEAQNHPHKKRRLQFILEVFGLGHVQKSYPRHLSGGEKQRAALARTLAAEPDVLLLDEPLSSLDSLRKKQLLNWLLELKSDLGFSLIHVCHDQEEAMLLADRIALMRGGSFEQIGTPEELYSKPKNSFVARFFGRSNLFDKEKVPILPPKEEGQFVLIRPENLNFSKVKQSESFSEVRVQKSCFLGGRYLHQMVDPQGNLWQLETSHKREGLTLDQPGFLSVQPQDVQWLPE